MNPDAYRAETFGSPQREPGSPWAFWYFLPEALPRALDLEPDTVLLLSEADAALGHLRGLGQLIRDPRLLLGPYIRREAVASSRIEGTEASLSDVLRAEVSETPPQSADIAEVEGYVAATYRGIELIETLPITQRLVCEVHRTLLRGVRGAERLPGQFRDSPVWVGSAAETPDTARFVPPLPEYVPSLLSDWERFVNDPSRMPVLVRCALMHYQFESIHPFLDGNGRIGRLLIGLMLIQENRLPTPLLYVSGYLEANRTEYYDRLQAVRERGEVQQWLRFFLTAVKLQAEDAVDRAGRLVSLREDYLSDVRGSRSRIAAVIDLMFENPFFTVGRVQRALRVSNQGARNLIREAEGRGWLVNVGAFGRGGRTYWVARDVFEATEAPAKYARADDGPTERTGHDTPIS